MPDEAQPLLQVLLRHGLLREYAEAGARVLDADQPGAAARRRARRPRARHAADADLVVDAQPASRPAARSADLAEDDPRAGRVHARPCRTLADADVPDPRAAPRADPGRRRRTGSTPGSPRSPPGGWPRCAQTGRRDCGSAATAGWRTSAPRRRVPRSPTSPTSPARWSRPPTTRASSTRRRSTRRAPPPCCATPTSPTAASSDSPYAIELTSARVRLAQAALRRRAAGTADRRAARLHLRAQPARGRPRRPDRRLPRGRAAAGSVHADRGAPARRRRPRPRAEVAGRPGVGARRRATRGTSAREEGARRARGRRRRRGRRAQRRGRLPDGARQRRPGRGVARRRLERAGAAARPGLRAYAAHRHRPDPPGRAASSTPTRHRTPPAGQPASSSPRATADPALDAWAGRLLGPADGVAAHVEEIADDGAVRLDPRRDPRRRWG